MRCASNLTAVVVVLALASGAEATPSDSPSEGGGVTIQSGGGVDAYPVLTRGQVVRVNAQRFVVTREPAPVAKVREAPPEALVSDDAQNRAPASRSNAIWVAGHWAYGATGFVWVAGRYVAGRTGHVFVPPRWAELDEEYLFFTGFYVPYGVYVRSHFNRYYYSGAPAGASRSPHGPYWPVGAPTRGRGSTRSLRARDPYWPIGARR